MMRLAFLFLVIALGAEILAVSDLERFFSAQYNWLVFPVFLVLSVLTLVSHACSQAAPPSA